VGELFIYYRIHAAEASRAREAVQQYQHRLCERHPGLTARLLRRADDDQHTPTWMEIYSLPDTGDAADLQAQIEAEAAMIAPCLAGPRHTEVFVPCAW
jgi:hypothetical protein